MSVLIKMPRTPAQVEFSSLKIKEMFISNGVLFQRVSGDKNNNAVNLSAGIICEFAGFTRVTPVNAEISLSYERSKHEQMP